MRLTKKRLLLALYRLEEGQQQIMEMLEGGTPHPSALRAAGFSSRRRLEQAPPRVEAGETEQAAHTADQWMLDGIQAILSYQREKEK